MMRYTLLPNIDLPGYCNHIHTVRADDTNWLFVDISLSSPVKRETVLLYRQNWKKNPVVWELIVDVTALIPWPSDRKIALGHSLDMGPYALNLFVVYVSLDPGKPNGVQPIAIPKSEIPPMLG